MTTPNVQVFRVSLNTKPLNSNNEKTFDPESGTYRSRKAHTKSRGGCKACRSRRKKCDELRPKCSGCVKRECECDYHGRVSPKVKAAKKASSEIVRHQKETIIQSPRIDAPLVLIMEGNYLKRDLELIHHFKSVISPFWGENQMAKTYATGAVELALEKPFLMHAMLAVAASHLVQFGDHNLQDWQVAEAFHCQHASRGLCEAVVSINGRKDSDAILTTSMLINALSFCASSQQPESDDPRSQWAWLRIAIGLTDLLGRTKPFHPESIWVWMFMASNDFSVLEAQDSNLGEKLIEYCGVDKENDDPSTNLYLEPCEWLGPLISRVPNSAYEALYLRFPGSITSKFIDLLEQKDERALLIFVQWLGLMCATNEDWWSKRRVQMMCWKICDHLMGIIEEHALILLEMPAKACGYL